jgi:hypothetical protein
MMFQVKLLRLIRLSTIIRKKINIQLSKTKAGSEVTLPFLFTFQTIISDMGETCKIWNTHCLMGALKEILS